MVMLTNVMVVLCLSACAAAAEVNMRDIQELIDRINALEKKIERNEELLDASAEIFAGDMKADFDKTDDTSEDDSVSASKRFLLVTEGPVAFSALVKPRYLGHRHVNYTIVFDHVLTNYGGGYNNHTGIFVAPLSGIYLISSSVFDHMGGLHGTTNLRAELMQNNNVMARAFGHGTQQFRDQGAQTVIVTAKAGDQFRVRTVGNNDLGIGGELYSSFSGYMLWQLDN